MSQEPETPTSWGAFATEAGRPDDRRAVAPSALRNEAPIVQTLARVLEDAGLRAGERKALEIASGTGQHVAAFARLFPGFTWLPSDRGGQELESIAAWRAHVGLPNIAPPVSIDLMHAGWEAAADGPFDLIVNCNMIHISSWPTALALLAGAQRLLTPDGLLFVYGCFKRDGDWISESNRGFDESLRSRDASWGVRDTVDMKTAGIAHGLDLTEVVAMPANNTVLVFRRAQSPSSS